MSYNKGSKTSAETVELNKHAKQVFEAQKSSQASSNTKGLQPEIANRVRVSSMFFI